MEKTWKLGMSEGLLMVSNKSKFYETFFFEIAYLIDGNMGLRACRKTLYNQKKPRFPKFPRYIWEQLKTIGFKRFEYEGEIYLI